VNEEKNNSGAESSTTPLLCFEHQAALPKWRLGFGVP
jgi:hypothetical protein